MRRQFSLAFLASELRRVSYRRLGYRRLGDRRPSDRRLRFWVSVSAQILAVCEISDSRDHLDKARRLAGLVVFVQQAR